MPAFIFFSSSNLTSSFVGHAVDSTSQTTYSFSITFDTATSNRWLIAVVGFQAAAARTISVTIGGVAATSVVFDTVGGSGSQLGIFAALVPTNGTQTVVATLSGAALRAGCSLYDIEGVGAMLNAPTTAAFHAPTAISASVNVPQGGVVIGGAFAAGAGVPTSSWSGIIEDLDVAVDAQRSISSASENFSAAQTGLAVADTFTGAVSWSGALAVFGP